MTGNLLDREASPYLLQHKDNPVHWRPWGSEAFEQSRTEKKPILLSVGYSACHWCHVMAHESFEDPTIADLMNELFVSIKVDREERPDVDSIYQQALALMGQQGGWPLTMFLTPELEPFWGGTYFPPTPGLGRPAFRDLLQTVHDAYQNQPDKIQRNTAALLQSLEEASRNRKGDGLEPETLEEGPRRLLREVDMRFGGIGLAPKFPLTNMLDVLWRRWRRSGEAAMRDAVILSVERMCMGGIYDHLGGGFARYSTDQRWLAPHFEKMLYDNAQLLDLMSHLWQDTKNPLFAARIEETAGWVLREMRTEGGGFASALDADSEGHEGTFYVWDEAEVDRLLGDEAEAFKRVYDVTRQGNWEGKNILHRLGENALADRETEKKLARLRLRLFDARAGRERPSWDDTVLADWNGLMIAALANAGAVFDREDWRDAARTAFTYVADRMSFDGRLCHSARAGKVKKVEFLDDYTTMARAALNLHELMGGANYLARAEGWVATLDAHYWDEANGGYFYTPDDGDALIVRTKTARDQATPAGNGVMVEVLARLFYLTGKSSYRSRAEAVVAAFAGEIPGAFAAYATLVNGYELLQEALQVAIIGPADADDSRALRRVVLDLSLPNRVLSALEPDASLPPHHPGRGKRAIDGKATAYVCVGAVCSRPITDPAELRESLSVPGHSGT